MSFKKLKEVVLQNSESKKWEEVVTEWNLTNIYFNKDGYCVCGHDIYENCEITNRLNGNSLIVGNICVQKFGGELEKKCKSSFAALVRMRKAECSEEERLPRANKDFLEFVYDREIISEADFDFYSDVCRKTKFTEKQITWFNSVNDKILTALSEPPKRCECCGENMFKRVNYPYYICTSPVHKTEKEEDDDYEVSTFTFGKHKGKTYDYVIDNDLNYMNWCMSQEETATGGMKSFIDYVTRLRQLQVLSNSVFGEKSKQFVSL